MRILASLHSVCCLVPIQLSQFELVEWEFCIDMSEH